MPLKYWVYIKKTTLYRTQVVQIGGLIIMAVRLILEPEENLEFYFFVLGFGSSSSFLI